MSPESTLRASWARLERLSGFSGASLKKVPAPASAPVGVWGTKRGRVTGGLASAGIGDSFRRDSEAGCDPGVPRYPASLPLLSTRGVPKWNLTRKWLITLWLRSGTIGRVGQARFV